MTNVKHKCRTCKHCDIENLVCRPNSKDCLPEYIIEEEDLDNEDVCDFYEKAEKDVNK